MTWWIVLQLMKTTMQTFIPGELQYPSGRSRYAALKERKARLAKSKSSATIGLGGGDDDDDDDAEEILTPFTSRFGGELARSRSSHMLKVKFMRVMSHLCINVRVPPQTTLEENDQFQVPKDGLFFAKLNTLKQSQIKPSKTENSELQNESSPTSSSASRQPEGNEQDENLSSWAKYLKNKYGGRSTGKRYSKQSMYLYDVLQ